MLCSRSATMSRLQWPGTLSRCSSSKSLKRRAVRKPFVAPRLELNVGTSGNRPSSLANKASCSNRCSSPYPACCALGVSPASVTASPHRVQYFAEPVRFLDARLSIKPTPSEGHTLVGLGSSLNLCEDVGFGDRYAGILSSLPVEVIRSIGPWRASSEREGAEEGSVWMTCESGATAPATAPLLSYTPPSL